MAIYRFEDLDDMQFQELCQAIALLEMPDLQPLPTRQRDGGFDSFELGISGQKVFAAQIKWVADQRQERDPVKWLEKVIADESKNLAAMAAAGTKRWTLMTNVSGTSYPDSGTIDRLNRTLAKSSKQFEMQMTAWWRDDLSRRLDSAPWETKLAYPNMLVGFDAMRAVLFDAYRTGDRQRLLGTLKLAATTEWSNDQEVRFKHGELDGVALQDIFLDVRLKPVNAEPSPERDPSSVELALRGGSLGNTVIYGAPGQGKSTLSLLVAQLHRAKLIGEALPMAEEFGELIEGRERVPIRIELRDYARWLLGKDPLDPAGERRRPRDTGASLESFAAFSVAARSGDRAFTVDDLTTVIDWLPVVFLLDGLDEVGDPDLRVKVVDQANDLARRYSRGANDVTVIVTSRPNFFGASEPSTDLFKHFELQPLDHKQRATYLTRWAAATKLDPKELVDLRRVYAQRIDEPHVKELATNPMQLAILLSLMHRRGESIPADRTQLYESYMEFFLDRESVTDATVKKYRRQLVAITGFLGWQLHVEAESGGSGRATRDNLIYRIKHHLVDLGERPDIAEALFTAVTQRVWVLSGRTEGSFEFEVQPIREYFAAKHLFDTAPAQGDGEILDRLGRFRELLPRPFWTNVARFLAGMFTPGEVAGLADVLIDEVDASVPRAWVRRLGRTLIDDGVFDDAPRARERVVASVHDDVGLILLANGNQTPPRLFVGAPSSVAIAQRLRESLALQPDSPLALAEAHLLAGYRDLEGESSHVDWWVGQLEKSGSEAELRRWLMLMDGAGVEGEQIPLNVSESLFERFPNSANAFLEVGAKVKPGSAVEQAELDLVVFGGSGRTRGKSLAADLAAATASDFLSNRQPILPNDGGQREQLPGAIALRRLTKREFLGGALAESLRIKAGARANSLLWSRLANVLHLTYGRNWLATKIAIDGVAERGRTLGTVTAGDITPDNPSQLMTDLRRNAEDPNWWTVRAESLDDEFEVATHCLAMMTCAPLGLLRRQLSTLDDLLNRLPPRWLNRLAIDSEGILAVTNSSSWIALDFIEDVARHSVLLKSFMLLRAGYYSGLDFGARDIAQLSGAEELQILALSAVWANASHRAAQSGDALLRALAAGGANHQLARKEVPFSAHGSSEVLASPSKYPPAVVVAADESLAPPDLTPLLERSAGWFSNPI